MRKLIKFVLLLVVIVVIAAVALPFLLPMETYKQEITARVKAMTGRDLTIAGNMHATLFPAIGIAVEKVALSNPPGFSDKPMLTTDKLVVEVELMPLFSKQIRVKSFVLDKPSITLEVNAAGAPNWQFSSQESPAATAAANATENKRADTLLAGFMLGEVKITDGAISYRDAKNAAPLALDHVNLKASLPSLNDTFSADADAVWNNEKAALKLTLANPAQFIGGNESAFSIAIDAAPVKVNYIGKATLTSASGNVKLDVPSLPKLAKWTGGGFDWKGTAPLALALAGELDCSTTVCALKNGDLSLDAIHAKGNLKVSFAGKPSIDASLALDALDLNPYLPKKQAHVFELISPAYAEAWSNEPIDLSGLRAANANVHLTTGSITYDAIKVGKATLDLALKDGALRTTVPDAAFYSGSVKSDATLSADGTFTKQVAISGVEAEPFLKDAADSDRFSGKLNMNGTFNGKLTSMRGMVESLGGSGSVKLTDGAVKGVDLAGMVRNIQSAYKNVDTTQQKTDFSELGGTFTIARGIISNSDLAMKAPLMRLSGKGSVDLPAQTINYRLVPEIVQTIQGQGGKEKKGLEVPIIVAGTLERPTFTPDLASMVNKALENPEAIKETVKDVKTQIKENKGAIKDLLRGLKGQKAAPPSPEPPAAAPPAQ